jgi:hypothetical protein
MLTPDTATFIAAEVIPAGARVKFVAGSGIRVELADAADDLDIGTAILHLGKDSYAADSEVGVKLRNSGGTRTAIATATGIVAGAPVYRGNDGKVAPAAVSASSIYGIALEASGAANDKIEVLSI